MRDWSEQEQAWQIRQRDRDRSSRYVITQTEIIALRVAQQGRCAICASEFTANLKDCVDHDHRTGKVRGLLCFRCNSVIGFALEDVERLAKAIEYLDRRR